MLVLTHDYKTNITILRPPQTKFAMLLRNKSRMSNSTAGSGGGGSVLGAFRAAKRISMSVKK